MNKKFRLVNSRSEATLKLPFDFFEDIYKEMDPVHLKIYLYSLYLCTLGEIEFNVDEIAAKLSVTKRDINNCFDFLEKNRLINVDDGSMEELISFYRTNRKETIKSVKKESKVNINDSFSDEEFSAQIKFIEQIFGKPLNQNEYIEIFDLIKNQGVPYEVFLAATQYSVSKNKRNISYISKVAINYKELGLTNYESCENYWKNDFTAPADEKSLRLEGLKKIFKIERDFFAPELEYIEKWCFELGKTDEEIKNALNKTVLNTGKIAFPYMDKVICNTKSVAPKEKNESYKYAEVMEAIRAKRRRRE